MMNLKIKIRKTNKILELSKEDKLFIYLDNEWIKLEKFIYCGVCLAFKYRFRKFYRIFNKLNNIRK